MNARTPKDDPQLPRLLLTVTDAATTLGISRTKVYELINAGDVETVKIGADSRVVFESLRAYVNRLREAS